MIKIICGNDAQETQDRVNEFEKTHNVFATQSHVKVFQDVLNFVFVIFYRETKK